MQGIAWWSKHPIWENLICPSTQQPPTPFRHRYDSGCIIETKKSFSFFHHPAFLLNNLATPQPEASQCSIPMIHVFCSRCTVTSLASLPIFSHSSEWNETCRKLIKANMEFWFLLFSLLLVWLLRHHWIEPQPQLLLILPWDSRVLELETFSSQNRTTVTCARPAIRDAPDIFLQCQVLIYGLLMIYDWRMSSDMFSSLCKWFHCILLRCPCHFSLSWSCIYLIKILIDAF